MADGQIIFGIEFKSQAGSFGSSYNNRKEEAIGSATELLAAYREWASKSSARPWCGCLMLREEAPGSMRPVTKREPAPELGFQNFAASLLGHAIAVAKKR